MAGDLGTLRCVCTYHEPAWHFDAKFVNGEGHEMTNVQKATTRGHFVEIKNSAYYCPYDLASTKVNIINTVYNIRKYDGAGTEHNYLFSSGMGDNHRGICFLEDEKPMRVYGAFGDRKPTIHLKFKPYISADLVRACVKVFF